MNDGLIVEEFFKNSLVGLLGCPPVYVGCSWDIYTCTKEVHLLAEVVVPGSCKDAGFLTERYCVSSASGCAPDDKCKI